MLEKAGFVIFLISPALVIVNAVAVSSIVWFLLGIFKNTVMTRLLKITLAPVAFIVFLFIYFDIYFDFDFWMEGILEQYSWAVFSPAEKTLMVLPLAAYILLRAVCFVLDWPRAGGEGGMEAPAAEEDEFEG